MVRKPNLYYYSTETKLVLDALNPTSYAFHVVVDSSKVNPYRDVVKKEGVVVKEEDQLDVDVKGSFLLLDVLRDQVWSELFMLSLQGRNLVIEHSWGAPKVKNVVVSLVKVAGDELGGSYWLELACLSIRLGLSADQQDCYYNPQPFLPDSFSQLPVSSTQCTETSSLGEETTTERKERKKWTPTEDAVLISAWLNMSKDPVVSNEQKATSPKVERGDKRGAIQCKQRWQKINDLVCKFAGSYDAVTRLKTSGQNENDVVKAAHEIFYNDYKVNFTLQHAWEELRYDQKWCEVATCKMGGTAKKRKCDDGV
ncbi:unnamed protein product [Brassica oleracea var. botrytis]